MKILQLVQFQDERLIFDLREQEVKKTIKNPFATGHGRECVCPKCGYKEPQVRGTPCMNKKCPKCGTKMIRE